MQYAQEVLKQKRSIPNCQEFISEELRIKSKHEMLRSYFKRGSHGMDFFFRNAIEISEKQELNDLSKKIRRGI